MASLRARESENGGWRRRGGVAGTGACASSRCLPVRDGREHTSAAHALVRQAFVHRTCHARQRARPFIQAIARWKGRHARLGAGHLRVAVAEEAAWREPARRETPARAGYAAFGAHTPAGGHPFPHFPVLARPTHHELHELSLQPLGRARSRAAGRRSSRARLGRGHAHHLLARITLHPQRREFHTEVGQKNVSRDRVQRAARELC